jgi:hypothetical protein
MEVEAGVVFQPVADGVGGVRAAVVHDEMQVELRRRRAVDLAKERQELLGAVALGHPPENSARGDFKGSIQTVRPVALVVVGSALDLSRAAQFTRVTA